MLTKCPFCGRAVNDLLRCQQCQQRLTEWKNWDLFADEEHRAGVKAFEEGNFKESCQHFERASIFDPDSPARFLSLGRALTHAGQFQRAKIILNEAHRRSGGATEVVDAMEELEHCANRPVHNVAEKDRQFLCRGPISVGTISDSSAAAPWDLVLEIEASWEAFAPFSGLISLIGSNAENGAVHYLRGLCLLNFGNLNDACISFKQSLNSKDGYLNSAVYLLHLSENALEFENTLSDLKDRLTADEIALAVQAHIDWLRDTGHHETAARNLDLFQTTEPNVPPLQVLLTCDGLKNVTVNDLVIVGGIRTAGEEVAATTTVATDRSEAAAREVDIEPNCQAAAAISGQGITPELVSEISTNPIPASP